MSFRFSCLRLGLLAAFFTVFLPGAQISFCEAPPRQVVVLGDSLAAGLGVGSSKAFPALLQSRIDALHLNARVANAGVSGDTSADGLRRLNWLMRQRIDVLILELGANDGLRGLPVESTRENLQAIITAVEKRYPAARIILAGMRLPPNFGETYIEAFRKVYPNLATKNGAALIPFLLEGVGGVAELNQEDHIHPNEAGHELVAENVWKVLRPMLEEQEKAALSR